MVVMSHGRNQSTWDKDGQAVASLHVFLRDVTGRTGQKPVPVVSRCSSGTVLRKPLLSFPANNLGDMG
jgi:hypothetical protein